jgi:hypothetical protein
VLFRQFEKYFPYASKGLQRTQWREQGEDDGEWRIFFFFFSLKRLKTYSRNTTTGQSRLNGLALMNIHRDIPLSSEQIIDEFSVKT